MKGSLPSVITKNCYYLSLGILLVISGTISIIVWPYIFDLILKSELTLRPNSKTYNLWERTPFPMHLDFYFLNWTNSHEIKNKSVKPIFEQVGPYSFRETKRKVEIKWNDNNTVSYKHLKRWYYVPERSNGSLNDVIVTLNTISRTVAYQAKHWSYLIKKSVSLTLGNMAPNVHINRTVNQLLFEGYEDPFITMARSFPFLAGVQIPNVDRFGWFYGRNGTSDFEGQFNMATGLGKERFGELLRWKYNESTGYFKGKCGKVRGSGGDFFPQNLQKDHLQMFSADLCLSMKLDFENEANIEGINGYKYVGGTSLMDNGTKIPENRCFCPGDCQPSGTLNVSTCRYGSPAFVSFPHFYAADPYYTDAVKGLKPQKDKHQFYITLEPKTGIPLEVAARMQLNILLEPDEDIGLYQDVPRVFFPVLWFEQKVTITPELAHVVKQILNLPSTGIATSGVVVAVGAFLLFFATFTSLRKFIKNRFQPKKQMSTREEIPLKEKESAHNSAVVVSKSKKMNLLSHS